jgi:hypothetical protein
MVDLDSEARPGGCPRAPRKSALARPATVGVSVELRRDTERSSGWRVEYRVRPAEPAVLNLALVEDHSQIEVLRGENARRLLLHRNEVRAFLERDISGFTEGSWRPEIPRALDGSKGFHAVAYVADPKTLAVLGADSSG